MRTNLSQFPSQAHGRRRRRIPENADHKGGRFILRSVAQLVSWPLAHPYWHASCLEAEPGREESAPLPGVQQLCMNTKCSLSFQVSHGSLRNGHHRFPPLSLHQACDLMLFSLHFYLMASPSGEYIDFSYPPKDLLSLCPTFTPGTPDCLPHGLFYLVSLLPHCFCSLPLLCVSLNLQDALLSGFIA